MGGLETLSRLENAPTDSSDRPTEEIDMMDVVVFVDPFEEFQKQKRQNDEAEQEKELIQKSGGTEDERTTWTGKRIRDHGRVVDGGEATETSVGKYLRTNRGEDHGGGGQEDEMVGEWEGDVGTEPPRKKAKASGGGFGNFDSW